MTGAMPTQGLSILAVTVLSVSGNTAYVRNDHTGTSFPVARDVLRAHALPPMPGERWVVDKAFGTDWTFAAIIGGDPVNPLVVAGNASERLAIQNPFINLAVYQLDTWTVWYWDGDSWVISAPPPAPEPSQVACQVNLGADVGLSAGDTQAQGGWNLVTNVEGYAFNLLSGAAWIQVPSNGQYRVSLKLGLAPFTGGGNALHACKVMKNGTSIASNTVVTDTKISANIGEGTWLDAWDDIPLLAGDKLYWQVYTSGPVTLKAAIFGIPSRIKVRRIGPN
jgi:hypothetical protein